MKILFLGVSYMAKSQARSKRKKTGGRLHKFRDKRKSRLAREAVPISIGKEKKKVIRTRGGTKRIVLKNAEFANVLNPKTKALKKVEIKSVLENAANRDYPRRNIITKGAVIETSLGKAKVTNRPGQDGAVNAVLM